MELESLGLNGDPAMETSDVTVHLDSVCTHAFHPSSRTAHLGDRANRTPGATVPPA